MKHVIYILALIFTNMVSCQMRSNIITKTEFNNIEINNKSLASIRLTEGEERLIENLYSSIILERNINRGERGPSNYWYKYNGFEFAFTGNAGTPGHPDLSSFCITNSDWTISILGKIVKVGDHINLLGDVTFNTKKRWNKRNYFTNIVMDVIAILE